MRKTVLLLGLFLTACPRGGVVGHPDQPLAGVEGGPTRLLVAAPQTPLWSKSGGLGTTTATLHQGVPVIIEQSSDAWILARTEDPMSVSGWARARDLGCRVRSDTPLLGSPGEIAENAPLARAGCTLRVIGGSGGWLEVETAPEPFTYFEKGPSHKDPVLTHTEFTGFIVEGWIPSKSCTTDVKPFYPRAPKDGELMILKEASAVLHTPGGLSNQIPGKALTWTRWVSIEIDGTWVRGRTDGQVVVEGWVPLTSVGALPNTNPLNKLAEKKLRDFEVIASTVIKDDKGHAITTLPGGQEVDKLEEDVRGCRVRTVPPVVVEGWVSCDELRNLSVLPEAAIEYGIIDGGSWPPDRGPFPNPLPSWPEDVEDEVEEQ